MADELLRSKLVSLFPDDEEFVDGFLNTVSETNGEALNRIARAITADDSTDETPVEAVEEEEAEEEVLEEEQESEEEVVEEESEEEVVEEVVEEESEEEEAETEEVAEEEVIDIELGENFVADLTGSEEFRTAVNTYVNELFANFRTEFDERFRALNDSVEEVQEWNQDKPARTKKRAVVSYRPNSRLVQRSAEDDEEEFDENASFADVAESSMDEIFGD